MSKKKLEYRKVERVVKGFASHRRLEILELIKQEPELSVEEVADKLSIGYKNVSEHIRKLAIAGLLIKRNDGSSVRHKITPRAQSILIFCRTLE